MFSPDLDLCHQTKLSASHHLVSCGCPERGGPSGALSRPTSPCWWYRSAANHGAPFQGLGHPITMAPCWQMVLLRGPRAQRPLGVPAGATQCSQWTQSQTLGKKASPASRPVPSSTLIANSQQTRPHLWVVSKTINQDPSRLAPCQGGERG